MFAKKWIPWKGHQGVQGLTVFECAFKSQYGVNVIEQSLSRGGYKIAHMDPLTAVQKQHFHAD